MRRILDRLYQLSGACSAVCIVSICLIVVVQVGANIIDKIASLLTGQPIGLLIPSYAEFTGFFLAAATFFALAYSFRVNAHIRVSLFLRKLGTAPRRWVEIWCLGIACWISGYFTYYSVGLVWDSFKFGDLTVGMVALPIWIPQFAMFVGLTVLTIAIIDDLNSAIRYGRWSYQQAEEEDHNRYKVPDVSSN